MLICSHGFPVRHLVVGGVLGDIDGRYAGIFPPTISGQEHLDTTVVYAEVSDPLLRQDYYQGIAALDPGSENLSMSVLAPYHQHAPRQLVEELKTPGLEQSHYDEILDLILANTR